MTKIVQTFYISTGKKNAMHTLRMSRMGNGFVRDSYVRNLAVSVEAAQEKAELFFNEWKARTGLEDRDDFALLLDTEPEYDITLRRGKLSVYDTRAIETIEGGVFPFGKHKGEHIEDAPDSYLCFFADKSWKEDLSDNPVMAALSAACMGIASEKGLFAIREAKRAERAAVDAVSEYIGTIGERRVFTGEIITSFEAKSGSDGLGYYINKVRVEGNIVAYIGNKLGETGDAVSFKATIAKHDEYKGVKSTQVKRPKIVEAV